MTCGPQIRIHQRVDPKQQISMTELFFDLRHKMLVYTCFAAHVSIHMACGNLAAHTALQTRVFYMEVSHYTHRCFREHESGALQIQWSESNMPFGITNTVVGEQHDQKPGYL